MPHIPLNEKLPGVNGLFDYRNDTSKPILALTQILLQEGGTLSRGERELIAAFVSYHNECQFSCNVHSAVASILLDDWVIVEEVKNDFENSEISEKMKSLLAIAAMTLVNGKEVNSVVVKRARNAGATDIDVHDTVLIAALFTMYNKYIEGLATITPTDKEYYINLANKIIKYGYIRN